jgi:hypothetical protein
MRGGWASLPCCRRAQKSAQEAATALRACSIWVDKKRLLQERTQEKQNVIGPGESLPEVFHGISRRGALARGAFFVQQAHEPVPFAAPPLPPDSRPTPPHSAFTAAPGNGGHLTRVKELSPAVIAHSRSDSSLHAAWQIGDIISWHSYDGTHWNGCVGSSVGRRR